MPALAKVGNRCFPQAIKQAILVVLSSSLIFACADGDALKARQVISDVAREVPEPASKTTSVNNKLVTAPANVGLVVTAHPRATEAAANILRNGGNAIDAAVTAQAMLGLVEPQSSGLGGGGFMLYWDAKTQQLHSYDGREAAPSGSNEKLFLDTENKPISFVNAVVGGKSVGVPGVVAMLDAAHAEFGALPWDQLFEESIAEAENGFTVGERLHTLITHVPALKVREPLKSYLHLGSKEEGQIQPLPEGVIKINLAYANTLRQLKENRLAGFYQGEIANNIVKSVNEDENAGALSVDDFKNYRAKKRHAVCAPFYEYKVCSMGPPSAGGITAISIIKTMEEKFPRSTIASYTAEGQGISANIELLNTYIEASRLAFADRNTYIGDPDFVDVPVRQLLSRDYIQSRAALIDSQKRIDEVSPGNPYVKELLAVNPFVLAVDGELSSTTHFSIADKHGNIVSLTSSIETAFGSRLMTDGFILNNQLTDFSFSPLGANGKIVANAPSANKRPVSSMTPTIVFDNNDEPVLAIGSPGGKSIISYVARVVFEVIAMDRSLEESINDLHVVATGRGTSVENGYSDLIVEKLKVIGHNVKERAQTSGLHSIQFINGKAIVVADKRREGSVAVIP